MSNPQIISADIRDKILKKQVSNILQKLNSGKTLSAAEQKIIDTASSSEKEELDDFPKSVQGMEGIATLINQQHGEKLGMACNRFLIARWRKGEQLPKGIHPFPAPHENNFYDVEAGLAWVAKYIKAKKKNPSKTIEALESAAEAKARRERAKANREARADAKEAGLLIERAVAERDAIGIVQRLHTSCTHQDEQEIPAFCSETLKQLGVSVKILAAFGAKLAAKMQQITERRVAAFKVATEDYLKGIES